MPTNLQAATSTTGAVLDPSTGDGQLIIKTGATAGAQVNALSFTAAGIPTFDQLTKTLGASGSIVLPGGLIIKWGNATSGAATNVVTYPVAFPTATVFATCIHTAASVYIWPITAKAAASFNNVCYVPNTGTVASGIPYDWLALGY